MLKQKPSPRLRKNASSLSNFEMILVSHVNVAWLVNRLKVGRESIPYRRARLRKVIRLRKNLRFMQTDQLFLIQSSNLFSVTERKKNQVIRCTELMFLFVVA